MPLTLSDLADLDDLPFDDVIDVRSPAEFTEDHLPGAINLPALSNAERARVGTIYVQQDAFLARKIGAALVARNVAVHLEGALADRGGGWRPLVYCWRGGQRSGSFASILHQIGWRTDTVDGGYRAYRRLVKEQLYDCPLPHRLILIDGNTGTAKTRLLHQLRKAGAQAIDLEGLADHRGSLFGATDTPQPAQKLFETRLSGALRACDPGRVIFLEAESNKIGERLVPPVLWKAMRAAPHVEIRAPLAARAAHLTRDYADLVSDATALQSRIAALSPYHATERIAEWKGAARAGRYADLAADLMARHYDPRYARISRAAPLRVLDLDDLTDESLAVAARDLCDLDA